jgi:hypothetical protein
MAQTSETRTYGSLLSTTLENWARGAEDQVTSSMFFYFALKRSGSWQSVSGGLGERVKYSLVTDNNVTDSYNNYDIIPVVPMDGMTSAFYDWAQAATTITISGLEKRQNDGEYQQIDLLETKTSQANNSIREFFLKALLQGNGINSATAITTKYTSPLNGSTFFTPLPLLVGQTPTAGTVGAIACNTTNDSGVQFWANQKRAATDTNFASFLQDLRRLRNDCGKGIGGFPDMHLVDQATQELYESAMASQNRYVDYKRADIPFDNVTFHGSPVVWEEYMPNWSGVTTVQSATQGTWLMLNSKYVQVKYDSQTNFRVTSFQEPENQDSESCKILWYGTLGTNQRRKLGVLSDITTTLTS